MAKIRSLPTASLLAIERALTPAERRRLLDAADLLVQIGGRSRDRSRYRTAEVRPRRKGYRPWRNRAVVYLLWACLAGACRSSGSCGWWAIIVIGGGAHGDLLVR